jgi:hypothetical protein
MHPLPTEGVAIELRELIESDQNVPNSRFLGNAVAHLRTGREFPRRA